MKLATLKEGGRDTVRPSNERSAEREETGRGLSETGPDPLQNVPGGPARDGRASPARGSDDPHDPRSRSGRRRRVEPPDDLIDLAGPAERHRRQPVVGEDLGMWDRLHRFRIICGI